MPDQALSRRELLAALIAAAALPLVPGCGRTGGPTVLSEADALALLDSLSANLFTLAPEAATSLGLDSGDVFARASYTSPTSLPTLKPYLRTKYKDLPPEDVA